MNSCDTIAVDSGSLSTSTPLQSKMTTGPPMLQPVLPAYARYNVELRLRGYANHADESVN
jgi:hypothetical protein